MLSPLELFQQIRTILDVSQAVHTPSAPSPRLRSQQPHRSVAVGRCLHFWSVPIGLGMISLFRNRHTGSAVHTGIGVKGMKRIIGRLQCLPYFGNVIRT